MARPLRLHVPGMLYHVMSRGNDKRPIFLDAIDYERYLRRLSDTTRRFRVHCVAYCLMPNHVHLVLRPSVQPLSRMMQQLNSSFCQWFNRRHGQVGHVLQGRFKALIVESDQYCLRVVRYVVRNPVSAKLVEQPGDWKWSSYRATAGLGPRPAFLDVAQVWQTLSADGVMSARNQFIAFVAATADDDLGRQVTAYGSRDFLESLDPLLRSFRSNPDFVYAERFASRPPLSDVIPDRRACMARSGARRAFYEYAYTLREIGIYIGRPVPTVWSWIHAGSPGSDLDFLRRGGQNQKIEI